MVYLLALSQVNAQNKIDGIIAVVGEEIILESSLQERLVQANITNATPEFKCQIVEEMLFTKLLVNQAAVDSIFVPDDQVEYEIDRRMRFFIQQFGSQEKLEKFYGKSVPQIKAEFRELVKEQLLVQQMQSTLTQDLKVTPAEVKDFFKKLPQDSLPYINSEVEIAQIMAKPKISDDERQKAIQKLKDLKERINKGEDFGTLAFLYSEDPGSARENGELGFMMRQMLVPQFAGALFNLEKNQVSDIVETEYGFHLIQMIERRGQEVNSRHILIKPRIKPEDLLKSKNYLDSVYTLIQTVDTLSFEEAAYQFSTDEETKNNGGALVNPLSGTSRFEMDEISQVDPGLFFIVSRLKEGEISKPELTSLPDGSKAYRIVKLLSVTEPHVANLKQDYSRIQAIAQQQKQVKVLEEWVNKNAVNYYIKIDEQYQSCKFKHKWTKVNGG